METGPSRLDSEELKRVPTSTFSPYIGAEARIDTIDWHGTRAIRKVRILKSYRNAKLDRSLRIARTHEEAEILHLAKLAGVRCPYVLFVDPNGSELIMEYVEGEHIKDIENTGRSVREIGHLYEELGKSIAKLHSRRIIHGDLTTKNILVTDCEIVLIDFGLSFISDRLEDRAADLHLLKQAFKSVLSPKSASKAFGSVIKGYASENGEGPAESARKQIAKIEARGRYAQVD